MVFLMTLAACKVTLERSHGDIFIVEMPTEIVYKFINNHDEQVNV